MKVGMFVAMQNHPKIYDLAIEDVEYLHQQTR